MSETSQSASRRTCQQCGMLLDHEGEFHPYLFCLVYLVTAFDYDQNWLLIVGAFSTPERARQEADRINEMDPDDKYLGSADVKTLTLDQAKH